MNLDALEIISAIICTIGALCIAACLICGTVHVCRADRRSRPQLRRSLGVMEAGR